jgi:cellobiose dehydrogenase (acceptor)
MADRLSEAGHKVLLIEKGPPSTHRWGGTMKPEWLEGEPLTRFDVPGLCNQIWHEATGIVCTDMDQIAGCVLGGGTAVNAGLWWKPHPDDWDYNFPTGWKSKDLQGATNRVFTRIPGTTHPSMDGILYQDEGFQVLKNGLSDAGWTFHPNSNDAPAEKSKVFAHTTFMFSNGERGGPLATYLVTANRRSNFKLWTNTAVKRVVRDGSRITGVEVECNGGGYSGTIKVPSTGRVILSAGTFGTPKLLFRSGIGPADQLKVVQEAETMLASENSWINLPVGYNLMDHLNTDVVVAHPNVYQYNYTEAWWDPNPTDAAMYLHDRSGILAAAAPNIGPMIWDQIKGSDGITRQLQWTSRMEGSLDFVPNNHSITMSQYLGRGVVSRGRMTISPYMSTMVSTLPYLRDGGDKEAVIKGLDNIRNALKKVPGLVFLSPADNITSEQYVDDVSKRLFLSIVFSNISTISTNANLKLIVCCLGWPPLQPLDGHCQDGI